MAKVNLSFSQYNKSYRQSIYYNQFLMAQKVKVITLRNQQNNTQDQYAMATTPIGVGKYAKVYKAVSIKDANKIYAVKVIRIQSEQVKKEYEKQLKIIKNLPKCPNLVKIYKQHLGSQNNLYIFQQYCESGTLLHSRNQRLGTLMREDQIYDIFYQISNGLITLLDAGIIHEDIKPTNILKKGNIYKLCDFGVSQIGRECVANNTRRGTVLYMPPQKLKQIKFVPNELSDIYSLGICIYETIFREHPYLKKRTTNPKQYLKGLQQNNLKPISTLMKYFNSSSLIMQNFLNFLLHMIDLNKKTRATLSQLKYFIKTTEPFKNMSPPQQQIKQPLQKKQLAPQSYINIYQSIVDYRVGQDDDFQLTDHQNQQLDSHNIQKQIAKNQQIAQQQPKVDPKQILKATINKKFREQKLYMIDVIGLLRRGIEYIRKSNFHQLNLKDIKANFLNIDLGECKVSRFLKYLVFQYVVAVLKRFRQRYQPYIDYNSLQNLIKDKSMIDSEFNKFLIECVFEKKQSLANQLKKQNLLQIWKEISLLLKEQFDKILNVRPKNKMELLSILYCLNMPILLQRFSHLKSIFSDEPFEQLFKYPASKDVEQQEGEKKVQQMNKIQTQKTQYLCLLVSNVFKERKMQIPQEIESESDIQVMEQND